MEGIAGHCLGLSPTSPTSSPTASSTIETLRTIRQMKFEQALLRQELQVLYSLVNNDWYT